MSNLETFLAARELLSVTKKNLQLVEERISVLQKERPGLLLSDDVSSEHRFAMFGAVDALDGQNGIDVGTDADDNFAQRGLSNPHHGIIRVQEDAAFVCTDIFVAWRNEVLDEGALDGDEPTFYEANFRESVNLWLRLIDGNTGRTLTTGLTQGPFDRDRGLVPFTYLSSIREGLGSNVKNRLFSEFTIPRAGTVRAEVYNLGRSTALEFNSKIRAFVTLSGFKVWGG